ncbi:hypothetical protein CDL15_Pgr026836 [Punica granatum]|uniref:Uncharacterized protein n=1 Tax=Punica granatum TaxID=22663 RepID=A0A218WP16_PUNGR|nr:hypothetical protein CDL15_Pgr026836 [Punica granatum]
MGFIIGNAVLKEYKHSQVDNLSPALNITILCFRTMEILPVGLLKSRGLRGLRSDPCGSEGQCGSPKFEGSNDHRLVWDE